MTSRSASIVLAAIATLSGTMPAIAQRGGHDGGHGGGRGNYSRPDGGNRGMGRPDMGRFGGGRNDGGQFRQPMQRFEGRRDNDQRRDFNGGRDRDDHYRRDDRRGHGLFSFFGGHYVTRGPQYVTPYYYGGGYYDYEQPGELIQTYGRGVDCRPVDQPVPPQYACTFNRYGGWRYGY